MKRRFIAILPFLLLFVGLSLLLYPTVSNYVNERTASRAIVDYDRQVAELDSGGYERLRAEAQAYNEELLEREDRFLLSEDQWARYERTLDVTGTGIMGHLEVPKLGVSLPIYHGTDEAVLQVALGHIEGSSLPVGGASTHAVISGHRGLPSARLLTDLDRMEVGDHFYLHVLGETLAYEVDQIVTVLPDELDELAILEGEDLCTLVTCTPYGVNSHRLLVRGRRVELPSGAAEAAPEESPAGLPIVPLAAGAAAAVIVIILIWKRRSPKGKRQRQGRKPGGKREL